MFISLPFILLIRGAIYMHQEGFQPYLSLSMGVILVTGLLVIYFTFFYGKLTGKTGRPGWLKRRAFFALFLVIAYCFQGLLFLSSGNAKSPDVLIEYKSLHPILRMSISTFMLLDRNLLITDVNRLPEDYRKMGLPSKSGSLHYKQSDGFVYAVDLRTRDKAEWKNVFVSVYFRLMGFNALRHTGTADHLHISLLSHDRPLAI